MAEQPSFTQPNNIQIEHYTQKLFRVRFTNGLTTLLSEDAVNEQRWGNIIEVKDEGETREIHYISV